MARVDDLQAIAEPWLAFMTRCLVDGGIAFCIVLAIWLPLKKRAPAQLGYALFLLVLLKVAMPISIPGPAWTSWLSTDALLPAALPPTRSAAVTEPAGAFDIAVSSPRTAPASGAPTAIPAAALGWQSWLFLAWASVSASLLLRFGLVQLRTRRIVLGARPATPGELGVDCDELARLARVRRRVRWLITDAVESPAAGGLISSYVLIPTGLVPHLRARPLTWVLLHELAHIRRGDLWVAAAQRLLGIAFFFHPAVWLANWLIDEQREFACDEDALTASRADPRECGAGFLTVVEWARDRETAAAATLAMFAPKSVIRRRLMRILSHHRRSRTGRVWTTACVLATALFVLPSARVRAEARPADDRALDFAPQDPDRSDLDELRAELTKLRRENAALQDKLSQLEQKVGGVHAGRSSGGGGAVVGRLHGRSPGAGASAGRVIELPVTSQGVHVVERGGKVVEVKPDASGIYVIEEGTGRTISRVATGKPDEKARGSAGVLLRTPLRYYVSDGAASVDAEVEVEGNDESEGEESRAIRGVIVDQQGQPTAGARVLVKSPRGATSALSDSQGRFEVREVAPGRSEVIVLTPDGAKSRHEIVTEDGNIKVIVRGEGESGSADAKPAKKRKPRADAGKIRIY